MSKCFKHEFECTNPECGAKDYVKVWDGSNPPQVLNCHKCRAGRDVDIQGMLDGRLGMRPTGNVENIK